MGVKTRLTATVSSSSLFGYFLNVWIISIQVPGKYWLLGIGTVSVILTITGSTGLASMVAMISLLAISYGHLKQMTILAYACLIVIGAIVGFFIWNYLKDVIFGVIAELI